MDKELIKDLREVLEDSTGGEWRKGLTSHHTVTNFVDNDAYHIAEFHHARDAEFCDVAHKHFGEMLDEIEKHQNEDMITMSKADFDAALEVARQAGMKEVNNGLLDALENVVKGFVFVLEKNRMNPGLITEIRAARAAIAKARGE